MPRRHTLSDQALKRLRDISKRVGAGSSIGRPPAQKRRNRPTSGSSPLIKVLITETIAKATWDKAKKKLTPRDFVAKRLLDHADGDGWTYNPTDGEDEIAAVSFYSTTVTVTPGKARFAYLKKGELVIADCTEIDLV